MARSPSAGIASAIVAAASAPGYLVELVVGSETFRLCTMDQDFSYASHTWTSADVEVDGLVWDSGGAQAASLTLGDPDLTWWTYAVNVALQNATVKIWAVYASASTEAVALWRGRIGSIRKGPAAIICGLVTDSALLRSPRRRVQNVVASTFLASPGKTYIVNGQKWQIQRAKIG
jgi:hypothetical protein